MSTTELRVKSKLAPAALEERVGKILTDDDVDVLLRGPATVYKPDGTLLLKYLPGALLADRHDGDPGVLAKSYATLHDLRKFETDNRGNASGTERLKSFEGATRTRSKPVPSAVVGAMDPGGAYRYCRLTAWSGREWEKYAELFPLFGSISDLLATHVPDRWQAQMREVQKVHPEWVIPGTAFTTITVNNTYPTGVHTDKGDLDQGFSTLAVLRRGSYRGGWLTFPEYRVAVDMQHGDLLLMDAHEWHGNVGMHCLTCDQPLTTGWHEACRTERISVVSYMRTKMTTCGTPEEELAKAKATKDQSLSTVDEMAVEAAGGTVGA